MDIKEIALRIGEKADEYADAKLQSKGEFHPDWHTVRDEYFAEALISSYKAELLKEVGEPVAYMCSDEELCHKGYERFSRHNSGDWNIPLFTSDQVAAAILKATKPLEDQLAKAEQQAKELSDSVAQKVAEACALQVATEIKFHWLDAARVAKEIRSGEWRKFVKEV